MVRATTIAAPPLRRTRRRPADVSADLLAAAAVEFGSHGYDGASTRRIAARAGAHQPQINYHFTSKEHLWRATVDQLFALLGPVPTPTPGAGDQVELFARMVRGFLRFSADHPELNRIINLEATASSPRLEWLVAAHLAPRRGAVGAQWAAVRASGAGAVLTADEVWEVITSYGALHFANEPMLHLLGGDRGPTGTAAHVASVLSILLPGGHGSPSHQ